MYQDKLLPYYQFAVCLALKKQQQQQQQQQHHHHQQQQQQAVAAYFQECSYCCLP